MQITRSGFVLASNPSTGTMHVVDTRRDYPGGNAAPICGHAPFPLAGWRLWAREPSDRVCGACKRILRAREGIAR